MRKIEKKHYRSIMNRPGYSGWRQNFGEERYQLERKLDQIMILTFKERRNNVY